MPQASPSSPARSAMARIAISTAYMWRRSGSDAVYSCIRAKARSRDQTVSDRAAMRGRIRVVHGPANGIFVPYVVLTAEIKESAMTRWAAALGWTPARAKYVPKRTVTVALVGPPQGPPGRHGNVVIRGGCPATGAEFLYAWSRVLTST